MHYGYDVMQQFPILHITKNIRQNASFKHDEGPSGRVKSELILSSAAIEWYNVVEFCVASLASYRARLATFSLPHSSKFAGYDNRFPTNLSDSESDAFPMIPAKQLEVELRCMYSNRRFSSTGKALNFFQILRNISLTSTFPATLF